VFDLKTNDRKILFGNFFNFVPAFIIFLAYFLLSVVHIIPPTMQNTFVSTFERFLLLGFLMLLVISLMQSIPSLIKPKIYTSLEDKQFIIHLNHDQRLSLNTIKRVDYRLNVIRQTGTRPMFTYGTLWIKTHDQVIKKKHVKDGVTLRDNLIKYIRN